MGKRDIGNDFAKAGADLAVAMMERIEREDRAAYDRVKVGVADGMQLVMSVVTAANAGPELRLEIVDHEGGRLTLASLPGRFTLNA